jgi:hypothetical protein
MFRGPVFYNYFTKNRKRILLRMFGVFRQVLLPLKSLRGESTFCKSVMAYSGI